MEIREDYQRKGSERATLLELEDRYKSMGYLVYEDYRFGKFVCDLYVEKDDVKIAFEIKSRQICNNSKQHMDAMRQYLQKMGVHYRVVIAPRPVQRQIVVEEIEQTIFQALLDNLPSELDSLSTHTVPQEVEEVFIDSIKLNKGGLIEITGSSEVVVDLEYDNLGDEELMFTESIPFNFNGILEYDDKGNVRLQKFTKLEFDTSLFDK